MCLQVDMASKKRIPQLRADFWTPIDRTPVERPIVGSDDTTQDPNETQGGVDSQHVLEQPVVGSDDTTQDPNETQGAIDSEQCVAPDMEFRSVETLGPESSHHSTGTTRVPRILQGEKVYTIGMNYLYI
jgi:hypothetical protein